jgi:hypothetical protein
MSQRSISRAALDSLLPPGLDVEPESDLDNLIEGIAENKESVRSFLATLANLRNPYKTQYLADLEKEFGFMTRTNLTHAVRRARLAARMYSRGGTGSKDNLQKSTGLVLGALDAAGFDVQVHENNPAVDPAIFLDQAFQMVAGDPNNAYAGDPNAYCGRIGGELLVNGPIYDQRPLYLIECGNTDCAYAGDPNAYAGYYLELIKTQKVYITPANPANWPLVFFVGGDATRDPVTDELTDIQRAQVPAEREQEFKNIILRIKPVHTWAGLLIDYV